MLRKFPSVLKLFFSYNSLYIAKNLSVNVGLFLIVSTISTILSYICTVYIFNHKNYLSKSLKKIFNIIKTLPLLLQLQLSRELLYYTLRFKDLTCIIITLSINSISYSSYILLEGFNNLNKIQIHNLERWEISYRVMWYRVLMRYVFNKVKNALMNEYINILKDTVIVGYVGLQDAQQTISILHGRYSSQSNSFQMLLSMYSVLGCLFYITHIIYSYFSPYHLLFMQKIISLLSY